MSKENEKEQANATEVVAGTSTKNLQTQLFNIFAPDDDVNKNVAAKEESSGSNPQMKLENQISISRNFLLNKVISFR